jgi:hypothetical protein
MVAPGVVGAGLGVGGVLVLGGRFPAGMVEGILGLTDFHGIHPAEVDAAVYGPGGKVVGLAGDAKAFFYQMPSARLRYRTVFDVDARPGEDLVSAWLGGDKVDRVVIDPGELERLTRTYWKLPPVPEGVARHEGLYVAAGK